MSRRSIPRKRKSRNWRKHLTAARRIDTYNAGMEVVRIEARLQMRLSARELDDIEARWQALPALDACWPQQRRDFLMHEEAAMDEACENGRQETFLRLTEEVGLSDEGARRHIAHLEHLAEVMV